MIAEIGHFALILAFVLALAQTGAGLAGASRRDAAWMALSANAALCSLGAVAVAYAALTWAFVVSDFSVILAAESSHSQKPLLYKITGVWGNHEGSMVLWSLILTGFAGAVAWFGRGLPPTLKARVLGIQGLIALMFLAFVIKTSNPFLRLDPAPIEGNDLNPLLQDPGLAFHPPLLYLGYVGYSVTFAFAVAGLLEGRIDAAWARWVRPWSLAAWSALTLGIALGSWWAYYELGWGGWWFWDPVENAALLPWLVGAALVHSAIVVERREALKRWTVLLAILAFSLSLLGTFLVRSGVLTSVHAFALDPERGIFILLIIGLLTGGALALYAWRAPAMADSGTVFAPVSREGGILLNNVVLTSAAATVLIGTLFPLVLEAMTGETISVGPPYFNLTFVPLLTPLLLLVPFGPALAWKRGDAAAAARQLVWAFGIAIAAVLVAAWVWSGGPVLAPLAFGLGVWLVAGAIAEPLLRARAGSVSWDVFRARLLGLPRQSFATALAHGGLGVMVLGIVGVSAWQIERVEVMRPGSLMPLGGYDLRFEGVEHKDGVNYVSDKGVLTLLQDGREIARLTPEKRLYPSQRMPTTEAAIRTTILSDVYVVLGDRQGDGEAWVVRAYLNPLVPLIWIGASIMALGGALSLSDRRFRIGAPRAAKARLGTTAAQAAE